jgi:hypothetical protein
MSRRADIKSRNAVSPAIRRQDLAGRKVVVAHFLGLRIQLRTIYIHSNKRPESSITDRWGMCNLFLGFANETIFLCVSVTCKSYAKG